MSLPVDLFVEQSQTQVLASIIESQPRVGASWPKNGAAWFDFIFGLLNGAYTPMAYHVQHDCYSASYWAIQHFVGTHRIWQNKYDGRNFKVGDGFDMAIEPVATLFMGFGASMLCYVDGPWWELYWVSKEDTQAEKEEVEEAPINGEAEVEEEEFLGRLQQDNDPYGEEDS